MHDGGEPVCGGFRADPLTGEILSEWRGEGRGVCGVNGGGERGGVYERRGEGREKGVW